MFPPKQKNTGVADSNPLDYKNEAYLMFIASDCITNDSEILKSWKRQWQWATKQGQEAKTSNFDA
jgi:hypothetical protein